ncbi:type IV toxin-antitoxin system AbiEi family antitoxin domain-containing protein [Paenarthrobacter nitroguajacolicus]|uniref:type IV toxin-antitoxin system AbiEi family antitoxin domain-containing protein n=1 Tax=Paenarthrobacter nitroguajacolicus TaxID=211146 RepID=UPI003AE99AD3
MKQRSQPLDRLPHRAAFTVKDASRYGVPKASLYRLRDSGFIEQIGPGLYMAAANLDTDLDLIEAAHKAPLATLCLNSALAHYGLIDEIPSSIDLALPRGKTPPQVSSPVTWHLFDKATFDLGRSMIPIEGAESAEIGIYSPERSIVDAFRLRASTGYETGIEALRNWLKRPDSQPARLAQLASFLPRSSGPLRRALEVLL